MEAPRIPYGDGEIEVRAPAAFTVEVLAPPRVEVRPLADEVARALARPLGSPPLRELARGKRTATICVPDASRPLSPAGALPLLLEELAAGGIAPRDVTVIVGLGLHARPSPAELAAHVGHPGPDGPRAVAHDPAGPLADLGPGPGGVPLRVAARLLETDLLLAFGWVEPHQYAGFSGGYKTAVIGCGSEATIGATHSPAFIDHELCRPGSLAGNPFQAVLREAGRRAGLAFVVNAIPRGPGVTAAAAGEPGAVLEALAARAPEAFAVFAGEPADAAVAGVKPPKDRNLYQASRGVSNLVSGATAAVREGGVLLLPATLPDGTGEGGGEKRFAALFREGVDAVLARRRDVPFRGGEQRAWVLAKVLRRRRVILCGVCDPARLAGLPFELAPDLDAGLERAAELTGGGRLLVVPDAIGAFTAARG